MMSSDTRLLVLFWTAKPWLTQYQIAMIQRLFFWNELNEKVNSTIDRIRVRKKCRIMQLSASWVFAAFFLTLILRSLWRDFSLFFCVLFLCFSFPFAVQWIRGIVRVKLSRSIASGNKSCHRYKYIIMLKLYFYVLFAFVSSSSWPVQVIASDLFEITTRLDDPRFRFLFHGFRTFVFNSIGKTGLKTKGSFLQEKFPRDATFPCDISFGKSKARPTNIHKLRPGGELICQMVCFLPYINTFSACFLLEISDDFNVSLRSFIHISLAI